jgi:hypothetical protein
MDGLPSFHLSTVKGKDVPVLYVGYYIPKMSLEYTGILLLPVPAIPSGVPVGVETRILVSKIF